MWRLDPNHGNAVASFDQMGRPAWPSREQIKQLHEAGKLAAPEQASVQNGRLSIGIPPQRLSGCRVALSDGDDAHRGLRPD